jgi:hypothetical protein
MTEHAELREMLGLHALDALGAHDAALLRDHLAACESCRAEVAALRETAAELAHATLPVEPSREVTRRILNVARVSLVTRSPARRPRRFLPAATGIAAAAVIAVMAVSQLSLYRRLDRADHMLSQGRALLDFLASPDVTTVPLVATELAPRARAVVAYSRRSGRVMLLAFALPAPPAGEAYQLWRIAAGVRPGFVFSTDVRGGTFLDTRWSPEPDETPLFGITLEPSGGVPEPTGRLLLLGPPPR